MSATTAREALDAMFVPGSDSDVAEFTRRVEAVVAEALAAAGVRLETESHSVLVQEGSKFQAGMQFAAELLREHAPTATTYAGTRGEPGEGR